MEKPPLPTADEVAEWLRGHLCRKQPGPLSRLLGRSAELRYEVSEPLLVKDGLLREHTVFSVGGEMDLLPWPALPSGSWGIFACNADELWLLEPGAASLQDLLRREGPEVEDADPSIFCQFLSHFLLRKGAKHHVVVHGVDELRHFSWQGLDGYVTDDAALSQAGPSIAAPRVERRPAIRADSYRTRAEASWRVVYPTLFGWMHDLGNLGIETLEVSSSYEVIRRKRQVLSGRLFKSIPMVRY